MSIKTILVHVADDDQHRTRLDVAADLARKYKAHLFALFITSPIGMPSQIVGRGASAGYLSAAVQSSRRKAAALKEEYGTYCEEHAITYDWVVEEGSHLDLLAYHAHLADLAVVSQVVHEHLEDHFRLRLPEELTMVTGCPVLLLPRADRIAPFGRHILVAWRSNREAVRAVRGSLDFLRAAERVTVLTVGQTPEEMASEREAVAYLQRHGIKAEPRTVEDGDVGETLLKQAAELGCDLMIMGAYGHSRLREILVGGVTRHVFEHTTIPVVLCH